MAASCFECIDKESREKRLGTAHIGIDYGHLFPDKNQTSFTEKHFLLSQVTNRTLYHFILGFGSPGYTV